VVVDWDCPEKSGKWAKDRFPQCQVLFIKNESKFHLSRARNIGAARAQTQWICFLDSDVLVTKDFQSYLQRKIVSGLFYRARPLEGENTNFNIYGTVIVETERFKSICGYDEVYENWGCEDLDLYFRLALSGLGAGSFPQSYLSSLDHNDDVRTQFYKEKDRTISHLRNLTYLNLKKVYLVFFNGTELPLETRLEMMKKVNGYKPENLQAPEFTFKLSGKSKSWVPPPYQLGLECSIAVEISKVFR
jgi:glycosyltransferase involved in cell wall biosynthesis